MVTFPMVAPQPSDGTCRPAGPRRRHQREIFDDHAMTAGQLEPPQLTLRGVYDEYARFVWLTLQRLGVQRADLDDVAHGVFVVVHRRFDTFDGTSRMTTWLFGICMRVAANYRRRQRRIPSEAALRARVIEDATVEAPVDELLSRRQERAIAERLLAKLSLEKQAVFVMFEIENISCQEIAQTKGIALGTVYSRLHAARKQLSALLRRHLPRCCADQNRVTEGSGVPRT